MSKQLNCIVLVDDNEAHNFYHNFELKEAHVAEEIATFTHTRDALSFILKRYRAGNTPELLFLDYNMPEIQGVDFIKKLKVESHDLINKMKIIMLSASQIENTSELMEIGATDFMVKPIDQNAINIIFKEHF